MIVLVLENVPPGFRGELTQWLLEIKAGVYVGNASAAVRDRIWKKVQENVHDGAALIVYAAANEQGYTFQVHNTPERYIVDLEGISLIARKQHPTDV